MFPNSYHKKRKEEWKSKATIGYFLLGKLNQDLQPFNFVIITESIIIKQPYCSITQSRTEATQGQPWISLTPQRRLGQDSRAGTWTSQLLFLSRHSPLPPKSPATPHFSCSWGEQPLQWPPGLSASCFVLFSLPCLSRPCQTLLLDFRLNLFLSIFEFKWRLFLFSPPQVLFYLKTPFPPSISHFVILLSDSTGASLLSPEICQWHLLGDLPMYWVTYPCIRWPLGPGRSSFFFLLLEKKADNSSSFENTKSDFFSSGRLQRVFPKPDF